MTKSQALFAANLQIHGKITPKEHTAMHLLQKNKQKKGLNKQGSYKRLQTTRVLSTCMVMHFFLEDNLQQVQV